MPHTKTTIRGYKVLQRYGVLEEIKKMCKENCLIQNAILEKYFGDFYARDVAKEAVYIEIEKRMKRVREDMSCTGR